MKAYICCSPRSNCPFPITAYKTKGTKRRKTTVFLGLPTTFPRRTTANFSLTNSFITKQLSEKHMTNILPYQTDIAQRMLSGSENETIRRDACFLQTANGYWIAWHDEHSPAAVLAPDTPEGEPCFWVEGAQNLAELAAMAENGDFEEIFEESGEHPQTAAHCGCGCGGQH